MEQKLERPICTCGNEMEVLRAFDEKAVFWFNVWYCRKCDSWDQLQKEEPQWVHVLNLGVMKQEEFSKLRKSKTDKDIKEVEEMIRKREVKEGLIDE